MPPLSPYYLLYLHLGTYTLPLHETETAESTPPLVDNSSALMGTGTLLGPLLSHTLVHSVLLSKSAPYPPPSAQFQVLDPLRDGYLPRDPGKWGAQRRAGLWLAHWARTIAAGVEREAGSKEPYSSCSNTRQSPEILGPQGDRSPQQTLLQEQTQQSSRHIQ